GGVARQLFDVLRFEIREHALAAVVNGKPHAVHVRQLVHDESCAHDDLPKGGRCSIGAVATAISAAANTPAWSRPGMCATRATCTGRGASRCRSSSTSSSEIDDVEELRHLLAPRPVQVARVAHI